MPVILSDRITQLKPKCFWLGGGDVDIKIRKKNFNYYYFFFFFLFQFLAIFTIGVGVDEFVDKYGSQVHVADVVYDEWLKDKQNLENDSKKSIDDNQKYRNIN